MAKEKHRPVEIDLYKQYDAGEKDFTEKKKGIREKVIEHLKDSDYPDVRLIESASEKLDAEKAMKWAKKNLAEEEFKKLFVKLFDVNAFSALIKDGKVNKQTMLKAGILTKVAGTSIRCFHDKEWK